jgi:hypothetical protein
MLFLWFEYHGDTFACSMAETHGFFVIETDVKKS